MYQVLARKWRPKSFDELVGQDHVARTLRNSIEANRIAHAYIFAGMRGTGKTTVARILAKCLNCEQGPSASPCGACAACREITDGRSIDVLEMDAASRTGVDDIRELQEVVAYAPVRDRYKVLIIDEAHMLSRSAANALLKTLEEPPARVVFVLATTEAQKLLPTILSRCQVHEFRRVGAREVATHLRVVCAAEGIEVSDAVLDRIARAGEGSVRDALSLLERVVAFAGASITDDDALHVLGAVPAERLTDLLAALARRDAPAMLTVLHALAGEGHDLLHIWSETLAALRDLLLARTLPGRSDLLSRSPEEAARLAEATSALSREDLTRAFQLLAEIEFGLKGSAQPQFLFEATLIRLADLGSVRPIEELLASLGTGSETGRVPPAPAATNRQKKNLPAPEPSAFQAVPAPARAGAGAPAPEGQPGAGGSLAEFRARLHAVRPMADALLDAASIAWTGDRIAIAFAPESDAVGRNIARSESIRLLESVATELAGRKITVAVEIGGGAAGPLSGTGTQPARELTATRPTATAPPAREQPAPPKPAASTAATVVAPTPRAEAAPSPRARVAPSPSSPEALPPERSAMKEDHDTLLDDVTKEPGIARLLKEFGAHVVEVSKLGPIPVDDTERPAPLSEDAK